MAGTEGSSLPVSVKCVVLHVTELHSPRVPERGPGGLGSCCAAQFSPEAEGRRSPAQATAAEQGVCSPSTPSTGCGTQAWRSCPLALWLLRWVPQPLVSRVRGASLPAGAGCVGRGL